MNIFAAILLAVVLLGLIALIGAGVLFLAYVLLDLRGDGERKE